MNKVEVFLEYISKQQLAPRPGLQWKPSTHRWIRPPQHFGDVRDAEKEALSRAKKSKRKIYLYKPYIDYGMTGTERIISDKLQHVPKAELSMIVHPSGKIENVKPKLRGGGGG